jgi:hypothetical protein
MAFNMFYLSSELLRSLKEPYFFAGAGDGFEA